MEESILWLIEDVMVDRIIIIYEEMLWWRCSGGDVMVDRIIIIYEEMLWWRGDVMVF